MGKKIFLFQKLFVSIQILSLTELCSYDMMILMCFKVEQKLFIK